MAEVTRTELNQQTARILGRVAVGERITITDRGRPVAVITQPPANAWDELVSAGRVTPARERGPLPFAPVESDLTSKQILDDLRTDRS